MITIPDHNWTMALADAVDTAPEGETIHVRNRSQAILGENARQRLCPDKALRFEYEVDDWDEEEDPANIVKVERREPIDMEPGHPREAWPPRNGVTNHIPDPNDGRCGEGRWVEDIRLRTLHPHAAEFRGFRMDLPRQS